MDNQRSLSVKVWGEFACFTRPEMKVECVSYPVMTPSAARGVLEAIYWKPEFEWRVREIHVLEPIRHIALVRNEMNKRIPTRDPKPIFVDEERTQRYTLALRDVAYLIYAEIHLRPMQIKTSPPIATSSDAAWSEATAISNPTWAAVNSPPISRPPTAPNAPSR